MVKDKIDFNNFVDFLKAERNIYVQCPDCEEIHRLSDLRVFYGKKPPRDWLDDLEKEWLKIEKANEDITKRENEIRLDAVKRSRATLIGKTLENISPLAPHMTHHPRDLRSIWDPVDFVSFNGIFEKRKVDSVTFIDVKCGKSDLTSTQKSIKKAVENGDVNWETIKISLDRLKNSDIDIECLKSSGKQTKL